MFQHLLPCRHLEELSLVVLLTLGAKIGNPLAVLSRLLLVGCRPDSFNTFLIFLLHLFRPFDRVVQTFLSQGGIIWLLLLRTREPALGKVPGGGVAAGVGGLLLLLMRVVASSGT